MKRFAVVLLTILSAAITLISLRYFLAPDTAPLLKLKSGIQRNNVSGSSLFSTCCLSFSAL
jgi:hypothetical protein